MEPEVLQKRTWSSVGGPWAQKSARVCFGRFPGGSAHPKLHNFLRLGGHPSPLWRYVFAQKAAFAGLLFTTHFLEIFRSDCGGSEHVKMWFWYRKCYETLLFQIANILAIKGSIFKVFREPKPCQNSKRSSTYELQQLQEEVKNLVYVLLPFWRKWDSAPPPCGPLKQFNHPRKNQ